MRGEKQRRPDKIENELNDEQHNGGPAHPGSPRMQDHGDGKTDEKVKQRPRSEEHTSELQSLMRISYDVFCLKKKNKLMNTKSTRNKIKTNTPMRLTKT